MNQTIDISFNVQAVAPLSADHSYQLFAAILQCLPSAHETNGFGIHTLQGYQIGDRKVQLIKRSRLVIRTPTEHSTQWLALAGKTLDIDGVKVQIGEPQMLPLQPATALRSRLVTTKNCQDQERFATELRRQLDVLEVCKDVIVTIGKRCTLRIKGKVIIGYEVIIEGLTADDSLSIQTTGLGGRRHLGCGIFVEYRQVETK